MGLCFTNHEAPITGPNTTGTQQLLSGMVTLHLLNVSFNKHVLSVNSLPDSMIIIGEKRIYSLPVLSIPNTSPNQPQMSRQVLCPSFISAFPYRARIVIHITTQSEWHNGQNHEIRTRMLVTWSSSTINFSKYQSLHPYKLKNWLHFWWFPLYSFYIIQKRWTLS